MSDSERSMLERPASSDYKKLRKECPKSTPTRRTDWQAGETWITVTLMMAGVSQRPRNQILTRDLCRNDAIDLFDGSLLFKQSEGENLRSKHKTLLSRSEAADNSHQEQPQNRC
jgi:hypothetical protein